MALNLVNLDERTRTFMIAEIDRDAAKHILDTAKTLNPRGHELYPSLLREAAEAHDDSWLAQKLVGHFNATYSYLRKGKPITAKMPANAPERLAEGEFNRFYLRGLSLRAIEDKIEGLVIYRAKSVDNPRPGSEVKIGTIVSPTALLNDLRSNIAIETHLGVPGGPSSGLSAKLP
jgi:hypothetical protein